MTRIQIELPDATAKAAREAIASCLALRITRGVMALGALTISP